MLFTKNVNKDDNSFRDMFFSLGTWIFSGVPHKDKRKQRKIMKDIDKGFSEMRSNLGKRWGEIDSQIDKGLMKIFPGEGSKIIEKQNNNDACTTHKRH